MPGAGTTTSSVSNPTVSYATSGIYTVTLVSSNSVGSSSPVTQTIQINALPSVVITSSANTICSGQSIALTAGGASTYSWNTGASTSNIVVAPTSNTSYTVTGTSSAGCKNTAVKSITVNALPTVNITGGGSSVCSGSSVNQFTGRCALVPSV